MAEAFVLHFFLHCLVGIREMRMIYLLSFYGHKAFAAWCVLACVVLLANDNTS